MLALTLTLAAASAAAAAPVFTDGQAVEGHHQGIQGTPGKEDGCGALKQQHAVVQLLPGNTQLQQFLQALYAAFHVFLGLCASWSCISVLLDLASGSCVVVGLGCRSCAVQREEQKQICVYGAEVLG
jgi:hypothetical protein